MILFTNSITAEDKDNKLMSSSGMEASEQEMQDALEEFDEEDGDDALLG